MNTYRAFYNGKTETFEASSLYAAKVVAIELFNPPKSKQHMVSVLLAAKEGQQYIQSTSIF